MSGNIFNNQNEISLAERHGPHDLGDPRRRSEERGRHGVPRREARRPEHPFTRPTAGPAADEQPRPTLGRNAEKCEHSIDHMKFIYSLSLCP